MALHETEYNTAIESHRSNISRHKDRFDEKSPKIMQLLEDNQSINQSINQISIAPISPVLPGSMVCHPDQCSTAK